MSHLHLPDGILPLWLVLAGWSVTLAAILLDLRMARHQDLRRGLPRLGFLSALMLVAMSAEILPLAYHLNLSVMAGILLGPAVGLLAALVVSLFLALLGHGGLTVVGLNTLILALEILLGGLLFRALTRRHLDAPRAAALSTVLALAAGTGAMVGVVWLSRMDPTHLLEHGGPTQFGAFVRLVLGLGSLGWLLEALVTAGIVRYLCRVRPGLLGIS